MLVVVNSLQKPKITEKHKILVSEIIIKTKIILYMFLDSYYDRYC